MTVEVYVVYTCGPSLCGVVAIFESEYEASCFTKSKNEENKFSRTSVKDADGVSLAWKMGDGAYWYKEGCLPLPEDFFEWD